MLSLARLATADDHVVVLLSGGASSLLCAPGEGLSLEEKRALTVSLLRSGAAVDDINRCSAPPLGDQRRPAWPPPPFPRA